jgi:hypothetical protein
MRIYDVKHKRVLREVTLYLTPDEAGRLAAAAADLAKSSRNHHQHVNDDDLASEVTIAVYTAENLDQFDSESRRILTGDVESSA